MAENDEEKASVERFIKAVTQEPWGAISRTHLNSLIFRLLVDYGNIKLKQSNETIANELSITPTKVANLRYQYMQTRIKEKPEYIAELLQTSRIVIDEGHAGIVESKDVSNQIAVLIDDRYLREKITQDLIDLGKIPLTGTTAHVLYVDADVFAEYYFERFSIDEPTQKQYLEKVLSPINELKDEKNQEQLAKFTAETISDGINLLPGKSGSYILFLRKLGKLFKAKKSSVK